MKNKNIIITGATGFVGKTLIPEIIKVYPKDNILCLVKDSNTKFEIEGRKIIIASGIKTKEVNLATGKGLKGLPKNPKLIIHLAAETDTAKQDHKVNDIGTINLYKAFKKLSPKTYFIHVGTMVSVVGRKYCNKPINEETLDHPTNEYTRTKIEGEKFLIEKCIQDKFRLTILRPNTIYGKGFRQNSLFDMLIKGVKKGSLTVRINWPGKSALVHKDEVVKAIIAVSKKMPEPGIPKKYLIYAENLSIADISKILHKEMNVKYRPINIPFFIWRMASYFRFTIPYFEKLLPSFWYNQLWRAGIIIDDAVYCKTNKFANVFEDWKPKKLKSAVNEIL